MIHRFEVEDNSLAFMASARIVLERHAQLAAADDREFDAEILRKLAAARPCSHDVVRHEDRGTVTVDGAAGHAETVAHRLPGHSMPERDRPSRQEAE